MEAEMTSLRETIYKSRKITRILTTVDATDMVQLAREILMNMGARETGMSFPVGVTLAHPNGRAFLLAALAQKETIRPFHIDLLLARIERFDTPKLVILNSHVALSPDERVEESSADILAMLSTHGIAALSGVDLYRAYRDAREGPNGGTIWTYLARCWSRNESREPSYLKAEL